MKPKHRHDHFKRMTNHREFKGALEWKLMPVFTKDWNTNKNMKHAVAAVHNHEWWWTLSIN